MTTPQTSQATLNHEAKPLLFPGHTRPEQLLRTTLRLNGAFSTITGLIGTLFTGRVAEFLGVEQTWLIRLTAVGLLGFAALTLTVSASARDRLLPASLAVSVSDLAWVVGTVAVLAAGWLSTAGAITMAAISVAVLDFGLLQMWARSKAMTGS